MRTLFIAGREILYPRNDVIIRALKRLGEVDVIAGRERGSILFRSISAAMRSFIPLRSGKYDVVFVGFYGQLLMLPTSIRSPAPVVFDAFISTYDTLCCDRKMFSPHSLMGKMAYWLDLHACRHADTILLDTHQHVRYFREVYHLPDAPICALPVSCNESLFYPRHNARTIENRILFYSTYLPLHGVETILQAAKLLESCRNFELRLVGEGPGLSGIQQKAEELELTNLSFIPFLPIKDLVGEIAAAGICLGGHFGQTEKVGRVVPSKIYQMMAMAKPVIAGDTSANRDILQHDESALLVPPGDPESLADAIQRLLDDPALRARLSVGGRQRYQLVCSEAVVTERLEGILREVLGG